MELFVFQVIGQGFISAKWINNIMFQWSFIIVLIATICTSSLAGPVDDKLTEDSLTLTTEGSGHGSLLDILGISDDDESDDIYDDDYMYRYDDDGGGGSDRGGAGRVDLMMPNGTEGDFHTALEKMTMTCYHCLGDGIKGCDVRSMLQDPEGHSVTCIGKCLNISSGKTSVYDCAYDMASRTDTCFKNGDTEMCFCTGHLCNGPGNLHELFYHYKTPFLFPRHHIPQTNSHNGSLDNATHGSHDESDYYGNETSNPGDATDFRSQRNNTILKNSNSNNKYDEKPKSQDTKVDEGVNVKETNDLEISDNVSGSNKQNLNLESSRAHKDREIPLVQEAEIDVIIPERNYKASDNSTSNEISSHEPVLNINELPVGNLKDSASTDNSASVIVSRCSVFLVCSVLFFRLIL